MERNRQWVETDADVVPAGRLGQPADDHRPGGTRTSFRGFTEWGAASNPAAPLVSPFGFTGEVQDNGTGGLVYLRTRWDHPGDGTFLTRDPFPGFAAVPYSQHPYQYGYSNPVSNTDPSGKLAIFVRGFDGYSGGSSGDNSGMWDLADAVAAKGDKVKLRWQDLTKAKQLVFDTNVLHPDEPVVLVGHSRGAAMIYELAYRAPWLKIDQIITFGFIDTWHYLRQPVARFPDPYSPSSMSCSKIPLKGPVVDESDPQNPIVVPAEYGTYAKPPWVKTMHNFYSQDRSGAVDEGEIIEIAGAFNMEVTGSKHTTVDDELFDSGVPNVGWVVAKHLIETTLGR